MNTKFSETNEIKNRIHKSQKQTNKELGINLELKNCDLQIYELDALLKNLAASITGAAKGGPIVIGGRANRGSLRRRNRILWQKNTASAAPELEKRGRRGRDFKVCSGGDLPLVVRWRSGSS